MDHNSTIQECMLHSAGRGIAPVPVTGAGFFDTLRGFAKKAYNFGAPIVAKTARNFARDIVSGLNDHLQNSSSGGRLIKI